MPVPASLASLSTTPASNQPSGGENPFPEMDDHLRFAYSCIATLRDGKLDASTVSAFILTLLNDSDADTARATLGAVGVTGNETVAGTKTFNSSPIVPAATAPGQAMNKGQFDNSFASSAENAAGAVEGKPVDPLGVREAFNATGPAPVYACRAWANFDGTLAGTNAPRAGGNVASITRNATGNYTATFSQALPTANYSITVTGGGIVLDDIPGGATTTSVSFRVFSLAGVATDYQRLSFAVHC